MHAAALPRCAAAMRRRDPQAGEGQLACLSPWTTGAMQSGAKYLRSGASVADARDFINQFQASWTAAEPPVLLMGRNV